MALGTAMTSRVCHVTGIGSFTVAAAIALASPSAHAHIKLLAPPSWLVEDASGNPQKVAPCGGTGTATGTVTTFHTGETITVEWQETVGHPGHFRIALATDRADLVDPKVVTTTGDGITGNSISAEIMNPPAYPVLLDGLFPRASVSGAQAAPFSQKVTLPSTPCEHCTLQVLQFMAGHPPPYFYHHCADLRIVGGPKAGDAGGDAAASTSGGNEHDSGGCSLGPHPRPSSSGTVALLCIGAGLARRRKDATNPSR